MPADYVIRMAAAAEADIVGGMVYDLESELFPELRDTLDRAGLIRTARKLLQAGSGVWAFIAGIKSGEPVGLLTLNECAAIYAGGLFGEVSELYVKPAHRSAGVGSQLMAQAVTFARARGWPVLEVGAPDVPRWRKTVDFYVREGFKEIGPRLERPLP